MTYPFFVDGDQKIAVLLGNNRPWGYLALLVFPIESRRTCETQTHWCTVRIGQALDDRGELNEFDPFILEESVYLKGSHRCITSHAGQDVTVDLMLLQKLKTPHDVVKASIAFAVAAIPVMDLLWTVEADPHHEVMFLEELAPFRGEKCSIGL